MAQRLLVLVGTRKGAFVLEPSADRSTFAVQGPYCNGWPVQHLTLDPRDGALLAAAGSPWYGQAVWRSEDLGASWTHSSEGLTYGEDGPAMRAVWHVTPANGALYAGVEPAGTVPLRRRRADLAARQGPHRPPLAPRLGAG